MLFFILVHEISKCARAEGIDGRKKEMRISKVLLSENVTALHTY